jgi:hypothetical protein
MKFQTLLESYGMLTKQQRLFYPRNFKLSPEFINVLKKELEAQCREGMDPDDFVRKLNKALQFYVNDYKKLRAAKKVKHEPTAIPDRPQIAAEKRK